MWRKRRAHGAFARLGLIRRYPEQLTNGVARERNSHK